MGLSGDFGSLHKLIVGLEQMGGSRVREAVGIAMAAELTTQVQLEFRESRDPWGNAWAPLVLRAGKPLQDTRAHLEGSFSAHGDANTVKVGFGFAYAHVHQYGATIHAKTARGLRIPVGRGRGRSFITKQSVRIPARPMLPGKGQGLPAAWERELRAAAEETLLEVFRSLGRAAE